MGLKLYQFLVTKMKKLYLLPKFHFTSNWNTTKTQNVNSKKGRELGMALSNQKKKSESSCIIFTQKLLLHFISNPQYIKRGKVEKGTRREKKSAKSISEERDSRSITNRIQRNVQFIQFVGKSPIHFSTKNHVHSDEPKLSNKLKLNSVCSVYFLKHKKNKILNIHIRKVSLLSS